MSQTSIPFSNTTTSLEAARRAGPRAMTQKNRLLLKLEEVGDHGATHEELSRATGIGIRQTSTRVRTLVLAGLARDSGATRRATSGFDAIVWVRYVGPATDLPKPQNVGRIAAAIFRERGLVLDVIDASTTVAELRETLVRRWSIKS